MLKLSKLLGTVATVTVTSTSTLSSYVSADSTTSKTSSSSESRSSSSSSTSSNRDRSSSSSSSGRSSSSSSVGPGPNSADQNVIDKKVSVKETLIDSSIARIEWCGLDNKSVLVLTVKGRLYQSSDAGIRWDDVTDRLVSDAHGFDTGANGNNNGLFESIEVSPADKNVVLAVGRRKTHFLSTDAGRTWRQLRQKATVHAFAFHPTRRNWALLSSWTEECFGNNNAANGNVDSSAVSQTPTRSKSGGNCVHNLFVTRDLGLTFSLITNYVVQFAWGASSQVNTGSTVPLPGNKPLGNKDHGAEEDRIYFSHHKLKSGEQPRLSSWSRSVDFCYTDDLGISYNTIVTAGNKFGVFQGYIFVARLEDAEQQSVSLMVSTDHGLTFNRARIEEMLEEKSYTILDTSEGAIVAHVHHGKVDGVEAGHIYVSDASGLRFTKSLTNNVRASDGTCDFDRAGAIEGVYIANQVDVSATEGGSNSNSDLMSDNSDELGAKQENEQERQMKKGKRESRIRTVISFDKGGTWGHLKAPEFDSLGNKIECASVSNSCSLHLHGTTSTESLSFAPFYSMPNAAGIILGTGNVGEYLNFDDANTYISIDAGLTWVEAHKKPYIYEIGDHGGLLVMAPTLKKTKEIIFSWNEGLNWYEFELAKLKLSVDNIVTDPNSASSQFLVYGTRGNSGIIYHLDFAMLGMPECVDPYGAGSVASDYYIWTPSDSRNRKCLLGRETTITRRKPTSECFNGIQFERPQFSRVCECDRQNYACEMGFMRNVLPGNSVDTGLIGDCLLENENLAAPTTCTEGQIVWVDAYRKIPGDTCEGGWIPDKVQMTCPAGHSSWTRYLYWLLAICFVRFCYQYRETFIAIIKGQSISSSSDKNINNNSFELDPSASGAISNNSASITSTISSTFSSLLSLFGGPGSSSSGRGFQNFSDVRYDTIQLDTLPETAIDSVGERWDPTNSDQINDDIFGDNSEFQEDAAPVLINYTATGGGSSSSKGNTASNFGEKPQLLNKLETAASVVPRLGAPTGSSQSSIPQTMSEHDIL